MVQLYNVQAILANPNIADTEIGFILVPRNLQTISFSGLTQLNQLVRVQGTWGNWTRVLKKNKTKQNGGYSGRIRTHNHLILEDLRQMSYTGSYLSTKVGKAQKKCAL